MLEMVEGLKEKIMSLENEGVSVSSVPWSVIALKYKDEPAVKKISKIFQNSSDYNGQPVLIVEVEDVTIRRQSAFSSGVYTPRYFVRLGIFDASRELRVSRGCLMVPVSSSAEIWDGVAIRHKNDKARWISAKTPLTQLDCPSLCVFLNWNVLEIHLGLRAVRRNAVLEDTSRKDGSVLVARLCEEMGVSLA